METGIALIDQDHAAAGLDGAAALVLGALV